MPMTVAIAVDLGGTKIEACAVDDDGSILAHSRVRAPTGAASNAESLRAAVRSVVTEAIDALPNGESVLGIGIGSAGPIDVAAGTAAPLNLPGIGRFAVVEAVRGSLPASLTGLPVRLALDGLCIALAEHRWGAGRGVETMLGMVVSTGIGGGIISRGVPLRGSTGNAGHIGQIEVAGFTPPGRHGLEATVERVASGPNVVQWARQHGWLGHTGEDLAADYRAGHEVAVRAVERSAAAVGSAILSATALLDIDLVVIGGGFSAVTPRYVDLVRDARDRHGAFPFQARARVVKAQLGGDSPLLGAAALVLP